MRFVVYIGSNCARDDTLRVLDYLSKSLLDKGHQVLYLAGKGVEKKSLGNYNFARLNFLKTLDLNFHVRKISFSELKNIIRAWLEVGPIIASPFSILAMLWEAHIITRLLRETETQKIFGIKFDDSPSITLAARSLGIPTYAIQHGWSPTPNGLQKPHEYPASHLFLWTAQEVKEHDEAFDGLEMKFVLGGPIWVLRHPSRAALRSSGSVLIIESNPRIFDDGFVLGVTRAIGARALRVKPHPYLDEIGTSYASARHPDLCDRTPFWVSLPSIAISMESSSSWELIYLGVPVITILEDDGNRKRFPNAGTFTWSPSGVEAAMQLVALICKDAEKRRLFMREQQLELRTMHYNAEKTLDRILEELTY